MKAKPLLSIPLLPARPVNCKNSDFEINLVLIPSYLKDESIIIDLAGIFIPKESVSVANKISIYLLINKCSTNSLTIGASPAW